MATAIKINALQIAKTKDWKKELYNEHAPVLYAVAVRYCRNKVEAEDILHDSFATIFTKIEQFKNEGSIQGWMRRIVVVNCIKHFKKNKQLVIQDEQEEVVDEDSIEKAGTRFSRAQLQEAMDQLPEGCRTIFNMSAIDGMKHVEIAEVLGISAATSRTQFLRAKKLLRDHLKRFEQS